MTEESHPTMTMIYVVLGVVVLLVMLFIFNGVKAAFWKGIDPRICRESVDVHMSARSMGVMPYDDLKCPPGKKVISKPSEHDIMKETADQMAECYWKFGENGELFTEDGVYCALCSHIIYEGEAKGKKISSFRQFLEKEYAPVKYGVNTRYAEYIIGRPTNADEVKPVGLPDKIPLDTTTDYGVMFVYTKNAHMGKLLSGIIGAGSGAIVTAVGGMVMLPWSWAAAGTVAIVSMGAGISGGLVGSDLGAEATADWQSAVLLVPWNEAELKKLPCTQMPVDWGNK
jgi:hypothetical protein